MACGTFSEHPVLRIIFGGSWSAKTADGSFVYEPGDDGLALYFGPCTKMMPLIAHGSFRVVTINFTPGGVLGLDLPQQEKTVDRIIGSDPFTASPDPLPGYDPQPEADDWLHAAESQLLDALHAVGLEEPHPLLGKFERFCFADPGGSLDSFADRHAITRRTLERTIKRDWGVTPKFALRRARALDMAAALLDLGDEDEESAMRLRYYDESHLIREMRQFFDATPGMLRNEPHPLLTITMEIRQSRRMEALAQLGDDDPRPWRDPKTEPASVNRTES